MKFHQKRNLTKGWFTASLRFFERQKHSDIFIERELRTIETIVSMLESTLKHWDRVIINPYKERR